MVRALSAEPSLDVPAVTGLEVVQAWLAAAAMLFAAFVIAGAYYFDRPFWSDEVLSWLIASDPNFDHGMAALAGGVDTNAPLLHLLFRFVGSLFGATPIVYRLTCAAAMAAANVGLYLLLRRAARPAAALLGATAFAALPIVIAHTTEARFYSFELAGLIWTQFWLLHRRERRTATSASALAISSIVLCSAHYFGLVALACTLGAELLVTDEARLASRCREWLRRVYPAAAGFATTACLLPLLIAQRSAMRDAGGTWVPDEFAMNFRTTIVSLLPAPAVMSLLIAVIVGMRAIGRRRLSAAIHAHRAMLCSSVAYVVLMLAFDRLVQPVLVPRYFIVTLPAVAAIVTMFASQASQRWLRVAVAAMAIVLVGQWWQIRERSTAPSGRSAAGLIASVRTINADEPIVSDWLGHALPIWTARAELRDHVAYLPDLRLHERGFDQAIRYERQMAICARRFYGIPAAANLAAVGRQGRFILLSEFPETVPTRFPGWTVRQLGDVTLELSRPASASESATVDGD